MPDRFYSTGTQIIDRVTGQRWPATRSVAIDVGLLLEDEAAATEPAPPAMTFTVGARHETQPGDYRRTTRGKVRG